MKKKTTDETHIRVVIETARYLTERKQRKQQKNEKKLKKSI